MDLYSLHRIVVGVLLLCAFVCKRDRLLRILIESNFIEVGPDFDVTPIYIFIQFQAFLHQMSNISQMDCILAILTLFIPKSRATNVGEIPFKYIYSSLFDLSLPFFQIRLLIRINKNSFSSTILIMAINYDLYL